MFVLILSVFLASANAADRSCHGNVSNLHPTGQRIWGVSGSEEEAQHDLQYLEQHRACYESSADAHCIQASVIAAIASRESRGGSLLVNTEGYGDYGRTWGIMHCDLNNNDHLPCKTCPWDSCCHIEMMTAQKLVPFIKQVRAKLPWWSLDQTLQGGVAAYNFGVSNVQSWPNLDTSTTGNDYSNDVIARAKYLYAHGWN